MSPRLLDAWLVDDPPEGFAERVAASAVVASNRLVTRRAAFGFAAAACVAFGAWKLERVIRSPTRELIARTRTEMELAPGAVAILERGARLLWDRGVARQVQGDVSYRVPPSFALEVETPLGTLKGIGACCRIKLADAVGQAAALFVSVAEGQLDVASASQHTALHRGEYARVTRSAIDTQADDTSGAIARELDLPPPVAPVVAPEPRVEAPPPAAPLSHRAQERPLRPAAPGASSPPPPSADAGARTVIVPSCFCDRGDSLCACFR